ncbi:hypothetical protein BX600DRAFT_445814 [Xylariales sp. PMI_506]|nr:hypothetical protein BX600DRAFT_445814 [Xylariales sp. PMI_506]
MQSPPSNPVKSIIQSLTTDYRNRSERGAATPVGKSFLHSSQKSHIMLCVQRIINAPLPGDAARFFLVTSKQTVRDQPPRAQNYKHVE